MADRYIVLCTHTQNKLKQKKPTYDSCVKHKALESSAGSANLLSKSPGERQQSPTFNNDPTITKQLGICLSCKHQALTNVTASLVDTRSPFWVD